MERLVRFLPSLERMFVTAFDAILPGQLAVQLTAQFIETSSKFGLGV
jgi:hypothetical protein